MAEVLAITGLVLILFFIFFIRPTRAEERRRRTDLNELSIGDEVLTRGGLIAIVTAVETPAGSPMLLHLRIAEGVVVRARTDAIALRLRTHDQIDAAEAAARAAPASTAGGESATARPEHPPRADG